MDEDEKRKRYNAEYKRRWREKNSDISREIDKKWYRVNKDSQVYKENKAEVNKKWREKNPDKVKKWQEDNRDKVNTNKRKRREDASNRLVHNMRNRVWKALIGQAKKDRTMELVGCTPEFLMKYLEKRFKSGMTWDNYGEWHVDHIKPCASFDLTKEEEQRRCFHYTNLQPLWGTENISKGAKY